MRWRILSVGVIITLVYTLSVAFINIAAAVVVGATRVEDDPSRYLEIKKELDDSNLVSHFPAQVPENATNEKFFYFGGFLQGGAYIQLCLQLIL